MHGLSTQSSDYQRGLVDRLRLPFAMLADQNPVVRDMLRLPTFEAGGMAFYQRLTMIVLSGRIEHVFWPVVAPDRHPNEVLDWLRGHQR